MANPITKILEAALKVSQQQQVLIEQVIAVAKQLTVLDPSNGMLMRTSDGVWRDYDPQIAYELQQNGDPIWFANIVEFEVPAPEVDGDLTEDEELDSEVARMAEPESGKHPDKVKGTSLQDQIHLSIISEFGGHNTPKQAPLNHLLREPPLKFDSLDLAEMQLHLEDRFGVDLTDDQVFACDTVGDLVDLVLREVHS